MCVYLFIYNCSVIHDLINSAYIYSPMFASICLKYHIYAVHTCFNLI